MHKELLLWLTVLLLLLGSSPAFAWRCDKGLVALGDSAKTVRQKCGNPDYIYNGSGAQHRNKSVATDANWYYNAGPNQLLRVLHFHKDVLDSIGTVGYGFNASVRRNCTPRDIRNGMSVYELATRCGPPKKKSSLSKHPGGSRHARTSSQGVVHTEQWTYDFGSQYLLQLVTITNGKVQDVGTARRHASRVKTRN